MTKTLWSFFLFAVIAFGSSSAGAAFQYPEKPLGYVSDYAGVLSPEANRKLQFKFAELYRQTKVQAGVAIFRSLDGEPVEEVATKLFQKWGLGDKKQNTGILLVLSIEDRAMRIEVGYGVEAYIPDALAGRILNDDLAPFLKQGQYSTAILVYQNRLQEILSKVDLTKSPPVQKRGPTRTFVLFFIFIILFIFIEILSIFRRRRGRTLSSHGSYWNSPWGGSGWGSSGWGGGWGGGFGGGGGGFSGGGGLSGGGGASGRW